MKTLRVWKEGHNLGSCFEEDGEVIFWKDLTEQEQKDFVSTLHQFADFYGQLALLEIH